MLIRNLLLLFTVSWSLVASATGGVLYTCNMKKETTLNRCCCPSQKAGKADHATLERVCCDATQLEAMRAPATLHEQVRTPLAPEVALPVTASFRAPIVPERQWEVVAWATAPPLQTELYLRIRTLLI